VKGTVLFGRQHGHGTKRLVPQTSLLVFFLLTGHQLAPPHRPASDLPALPLPISSSPPHSLAARLTRLATYLPTRRTRASLARLAVRDLALSFSLWRPRRLAATPSPATTSRGHRSSAWTPTPPSASPSAAPPRPSPSSTWTPRSSCSRCGGRRRRPRETGSASACRALRGRAAPRCCPPAPASCSRTTAFFSPATRRRAPRRRSTPRRARRRRPWPARPGAQLAALSRCWRRGGSCSGTCASSCPCAARRGRCGGCRCQQGGCSSPRHAPGRWPRRPQRAGRRPAPPRRRRPPPRSTGATATPTSPCATPSSTARNPCSPLAPSAEWGSRPLAMQERFRRSD
jgi:hypothetical protein